MDEKIKISPTEAMRLAIQEARLGAGHVAPNPLVGCTIVDSAHHLLAVGYHHKVGHGHAEIDALSQLKDRSVVEGAHIYVTLEPCAHQGRTPSCARTLAPLKPASVTYAVEDPNPLVAGKGGQILSQAGVQVRLFSDRDDVPLAQRNKITQEAEELAEIFLHNHRSHRPFVAVKVASTLDGQLAFKSGESKWITSEASREHAHLIRARYDAVVIGVETLLKDDPSLDVRVSQYAGHSNRVVILDPHARSFDFLKNARMTTVRPASSIIVATRDEPSDAAASGVKILKVSRDPSGPFIIDDLLTKLAAEGITSIMVEGGARTIGAFFTAKRVERLHLYQAPILFGETHAVAWSSGFGVQSMAGKVRIEQCERIDLGSDSYVTGKVSFS